MSVLPGFPASPDPSGITFDPGTGELVVTDAEIEEYTYYEPARVNLWNLTTAAPPVVTSTGSTLILSHLTCPVPIPPDPPCPGPTSWSREPTGVAYSAARDRFWTTDDVRDDLFEIDPGGDGLLGTGDDVRKKIIPVDEFGSLDPEGVTYNAALDVLHIIDGASETIYTLDPGPNDRFEGAGSDDIITSFGCFDHGCRKPEGITWNATTGRLAVLNKAGSKGLQEYSVNGFHLRDIDISAAPVVNPGGVTWGPASSGGGMNLWVVDRGIDDPTPIDGQLFEARSSRRVCRGGAGRDASRSAVRRRRCRRSAHAAGLDPQRGRRHGHGWNRGRDRGWHRRLLGHQWRRVRARGGRVRRRHDQVSTRPSVPVVYRRFRRPALCPSSPTESAAPIRSLSPAVPPSQRLTSRLPRRQRRSVTWKPAPR